MRFAACLPRPWGSRQALTASYAYHESWQKVLLRKRERSG